MCAPLDSPPSPRLMYPSAVAVPRHSRFTSVSPRKRGIIFRSISAQTCHATGAVGEHLRAAGGEAQRFIGRVGAATPVAAERRSLHGRVDDRLRFRTRAQELEADRLGVLLQVVQ